MSRVGIRLLYGAGGAVGAVKEAAYTMFVLLFYTQVLGLSGTITGLIIATSLLWDGISDPLVGSLSDRLRSRFGRRHPFMALSILPLGVGFLGLFAPPQWAIDSSGLLAAWLLFWSLWIRTFVTTFGIPHLALSAEITSDYHERTQILGARMGFMFLCAVLLPALALAFIFPEYSGVDGRFERANYPLYGLLSCIVIWVMASISTFGTRHYIQPEVAQPGGSRTTFIELSRDLWRTLGNRNFRYLIAYDLAATSAYGVIASLNMLVWTFFWEFSALEISIILSVPTLLAVVLAMLTLGPLGRLLPKHRLVQFALTGLILNCLWLYPPQLAGWLPDDNQQLAFVLNFIFMLIFMYLFLVRIVNSTSMVADLTDEHELDHGVRQEAGFFSVINFVSKMATVVGPLYGGLALDVVGLEAGMRPGEVSMGTLHGLVYALGLGVIPPLVIALLIIARVTTSQAHVEAIQTQIKSRRSMEAAGTGD
ncbi:sugar transporter [Kineobactrum sediminis]|uniref:Sugar transporter n=1 Tax=Kineobactrum sediminis TaxID=1905677 RepID=A0A2N5Y5E6_9GAMM|nr:MFS transporter [Kineobactrum sediminis]PLW83592.1 sugar transporter [Kineobactrum sediminis]